MKKYPNIFLFIFSRREQAANEERCAPSGRLFQRVLRGENQKKEPFQYDMPQWVLLSLFVQSERGTALFDGEKLFRL